MNLTDITFPVYNITGFQPPETVAGISFTYTESFNEDTGEAKSRVRILDDKNIAESTLGKRRLKLLMKKVTLHRLNRGIFFIGDFIKLANPRKFFIDSSGKIFQYKKETRAKLEYKDITNVIPLKAGGALLEVKGIPYRMKCLFAPKETETIAGVLKLPKAYILYGLYTEKHEPSWRRI